MKKQMFGVIFATSLLATTAQAQRLLPPSNVPGIQQNVQAVESFRVNELEEKIRNLNGKVEELNFLLLQLQEKFRKMEEDNESRFQEIEEKLSSAGGDDGNKLATRSDTGDTRLGKPRPSGATQPLDGNTASNQGATTPAKPAPANPSNDTALNDRPSSNSSSGNRGEPPRALGTLVFDKDGNVIDGETGSRPSSTSLPFGSGTEGAVEASEFGSTPNEVFQVAKSTYDQRQYAKAEQILRAHMKAWPKDTKTGTVRHYLGESLFWQKKYYDAAEMHLETHNNFPEEPTAADNLLGLGLALAGLNQREVACATYAEVLKQYPDARARLENRVKDEQAAARC